MALNAPLLREDRNNNLEERAFIHEKSRLLLDTDVVPRLADHDSFVTFLCDPNYRPYRYLIALLLSMIEGILSYCAEFPAGLQSTIIEVLEVDNTNYDMIFSAFAWPDVLMAILGTIMVDKFIGMRKGLVLFCVIVLAGQTTVSIGAYINSFDVMLIGRLLLGSGTGTVVSLISAFLILWFEGKEITFIFSMSRCFHRLAAALALFTPQFTYDGLNNLIASPYYRHCATQMLCTLMCLLAVIFSVIVALLDRRGANIIGRRSLPKKNVSVKGALNFSLVFWSVILICSIYYGIIVSFTANASLFFVNKFGFSIKAASLANSLSYLVVIFVTPFVAIVIDIIGYNLVWGLSGVSFAIMTLVLYVFGRNMDSFIPFLGAVTFSLSLNLFSSSMWVVPGYVAPKHQLTTAYGMMMAFYALSIAVLDVSAGVTIDIAGYLILCIFFLVLLIFVITSGTLLSLWEVISGKRLINASGKSRRT